MNECHSNARLCTSQKVKVKVLECYNTDIVQHPRYTYIMEADLIQSSRYNIVHYKLRNLIYYL